MAESPARPEDTDGAGTPKPSAADPALVEALYSFGPGEGPFGPRPPEDAATGPWGTRGTRVVPREDGEDARIERLSEKHEG
jgi:hypothetical protein